MVVKPYGETGIKIAEAMQIPTSRTPIKGKLNLRWGNADGTTRREINKRTAINRATQKYNTLQILKKHKVNIPPFAKTPASLKPPIFKRKFKHTGGSDIEIYTTKKDLKTLTDGYYTQYIPQKKEYRIHVINNKIIDTTLKVPMPSADEYIRNNDNGWHFQTIPTCKKALTIEALRAIKALQLDFGAVDIILGKDDKPYILEVNTAPGLNRRRRLKYQKAFTELILTRNTKYKKRKTHKTLKPDKKVKKK